MTAIADSDARRQRLFQMRDGAPGNGRGYSRLVRSLRLLLPLLAAGILVFTILFPSIDWRESVVPEGVDFEFSPRDAQQISMRTARLVGTDEAGRPYELAAVEARQGQDGDETVLLDRPAGQIELESGASLSMEAASGVFHRKEETIDLNGSVTVVHGRGYRFTSKSATLDLNAGRASGDDPIDGFGPEGEIHGQGFEILDKGRTVKILGESRLIFNKTPEQQ